MIVHNLTDHSLPYRKPRKPRPLKVAGVVIEPGKHADIPDHRLQPADIAGWLTANEASIDGLPEWYQAARRKKQDRSSPVRLAPEPEVELDVVVEEAAVKSDSDGEVDIKSKTRSKKKGKKKSD